MARFSYLVFIASLFGLFAQASSAADKCSYAIDTKNSVIEATGYKFTEKKAVGAKILGVTFGDTKSVPSGDSVQALFEGLVVNVDLMTLDSGNGIRDNNLREHLLSYLKGEAVAKVSVKTYKNQKMQTVMNLNGVDKDVTFKVEEKTDAKGAAITATSSIEGADFLMGKGLAALAKRCKSLHTGSDGKAKTWSDFGLKVSVKLLKTCSPS